MNLLSWYPGLLWKGSWNLPKCSEPRSPLVDSTRFLSLALLGTLIIFVIIDGQAATAGPQGPARTAARAPVKSVVRAAARAPVKSLVRAAATAVNSPRSKVRRRPTRRRKIVKTSKKNSLPAKAAAAPVPSGCTTEKCHQGIASIREPDSGMMRKIKQWGRAAGDPEGCVVCHGGDPKAVKKEKAHQGAPASLHGPRGFYRDPGSPWVNKYSCGYCHPEQVRTQWNSLMMTEAGKIQGTAWSFGLARDYKHKWGNYAARNPKQADWRLGTDYYRAYMRRLAKLEPGAYPASLKKVPEAPRDMAKLAREPGQAAFTYLRTECQRCHLGVKGRQKRGDYRGMGCSACHIPYSNEGLYEGADKSIPRDKPGHLLVHSIQSTRRVKVKVNGKTYSGIPVETCTTCHDRGKRIGVSYQGLMESSYKTPYAKGGAGQAALHSKHYLAMKEDIHYQKGMLCQDCHTSSDIHGDGFLTGSTLGQVEIECTDCHGTTRAYPWELPLGFGDEFGKAPRKGAPRGVSRTLPDYLRLYASRPAREGYLLTARGNPMPRVVREGAHVVVRTAGGKDLKLKPLKMLKEKKKLKTEGLLAMDGVAAHTDKLECYACHATWAPQYYGCHVKVDYSASKRSFDWVAAGRLHGDKKHAADANEKNYNTYVPGEVEEGRSYLRWEEPALAMNGEGRVSPVIPGCQTSVTVIGPKGKDLLRNHIFRSPPKSEGAGAKGQLVTDISPVNPHTSGKPRTCASCHQSAKALGYGIGGGKLNRPWNKAVVVDLMTADRQVIPRKYRNQIEPVAGLEGDWSRFVTEKGKQLQTVGHHFSRSRPLSSEERAHMDRKSICVSCHREIPKESLGVSLMHHLGRLMGMLPKTDAEHSAQTRKILLLAAWGQVLGGLALLFLLLSLVVWIIRRNRKRGRRRGRIRLS